MFPKRSSNRPSRSHRRTIPAIVGLVALVAVGGCADRDGPGANERGATPAPPAAIAHPARAALPFDATGRPQVSATDRCAVCGMRVAEHPEFAAAIELADDGVYAFCGTGCAIRSWRHPEIFLGSPPSALRRLVVLDYFQGEPIDGSAAFWVAGSDVVGPMGKALVPLKSAEDLAVFRERHGGPTTFRLDELDDAAWEKITGKSATRLPERKPKHE